MAVSTLLLPARWPIVSNKGCSFPSVSSTNRSCDEICSSSLQRLAGGPEIMASSAKGVKYSLYSGDISFVS